MNFLKPTAGPVASLAQSMAAKSPALGLAATCAALAVSAAMAPTAAQAATMGPAFASSYAVTNMGNIASVPSRYGGLTFLDSNTLLIGGNAAYPEGAIYSVPVVRGADGHIQSFGASTKVSTAPYIDGGLVVAPNGTILFSQFGAPTEKIGQIPLGATAPTKYVTSPVNTGGASKKGGALQFIPTGFAGAGNLLISNYWDGTFRTASLAADGQGTFNLTTVSPVNQTSYYAEGAVYVAAGNPGFAANSLVVSDYYAGAVYSFALDNFGTPRPSTAKTFVSDVKGVEGAAIDPLTGDFFFSTYGTNSEIYSVSGFTVLSPGAVAAVPEPQTYAMLLAGLAIVGRVARRKQAV